MIVHPVRIALLTAALLSAPSSCSCSTSATGLSAPCRSSFAASAISVLVVLRLYGILRALEHSREGERSARADAEQAQMLLALQNDQLVEADRLKDEFVALISHDLRTPLTSIIGYVELVARRGRTAARRGAPWLPEDRVEKLGATAAPRRRPAVRRAAAGGKAHPRARGQLDLGTIAAQAVEEARPRAEGKGLALEFVGDSPVLIDADKGRLFQLLDNLISNAIKFTPEGGRVEVRVSPHRERRVARGRRYGHGARRRERRSSCSTASSAPRASSRSRCPERASGYSSRGRSSRRTTARSLRRIVKAAARHSASSCRRSSYRRSSSHDRTAHSRRRR